MKREDVKKLFPDATEEQISGLLDINSRDIGAHKKAAEDAAKELETARTTISSLETNAKDANALQKVIDDYKAADEKRKQEAKEAAEHAERFGRFEKAHEAAGKDRKWLNDFTRDGIFGQFEKALADTGNAGKSDVEIYNAIVNDDKGVKPGLFQPQVAGGMPGMGGAPSGDAAWLQAKYGKNPFFEG